MARRHQADTSTADYTQYRQEFPEIPFDRYRITQHVGKGAFSKVFLAYTPEFQRRAIKRIRLTAKPHQLLKEIEFLRRLEGKSHIVQIKEIRFSDATLQTTVITSYSDTDDFKSVILDFTPREIQAYMRSILTALSHLEKLKIIHRDIKPGNFLFERKTGKGLLIDFGLAQTLREVREFPLLRGQSKSRKGVIHINLDRLMRQSNQYLTDLTAQGEETYYTARMSLKEGQTVPATHVTGSNTATSTNVVRPNDDTAERLPIAGYINKDHSTFRPLPPSAHSGTHGYRAPEILVPVRNQDCKIDSWSVGVILIQILTGKTSLFRGNPTVDIYEILAIRSIIGTDRFIQGMSRLKADFSLTAGAPMPQAIALEELAEWYNPDLLAVLPASCFDLCRKLLEFDPESRLSATEALSHPFLAMDENLLPNYRFQDGAHSKSLLSFTGYANATNSQDSMNREEETLQALRKRGSEIAERLGLCRVTSETLADEYSTMSPQSMIPLPRDLRKQAMKSVQKFALDKTVQGPSGIIVERSKTSDYSFPSNSSVQDLSSCGGVTLSRPRLAAAPGSHARHCAIDAAMRQKIAYYKEKGIRVTLDDLHREVLDQQWEIANKDKETFERAVRATAVRRRLDPWVQPLKALDKELRICQKDVRKAAEEYRRAVLSLGIIDLENKATDEGHQRRISAGLDGEKDKLDTKGEQGRAQLSGVAGIAVTAPGAGTFTNYHSYLSALVPSPNALKTAVNIKLASDAKIQVAKTMDVKTVESFYYPKYYAINRIRTHRLLNFIVKSELAQTAALDTGNSIGVSGVTTCTNHLTKTLATVIATKAWDAVHSNSSKNIITREKSQSVYDLTMKAAKIASVSHRLALSGPDAWEAKGESFFLSPNSRLGMIEIKADECKFRVHDFNTKILQHQHHASQCQFIIQERTGFLSKIAQLEESIRNKINANAEQIRILQGTLKSSSGKNETIQEEINYLTAQKEQQEAAISKFAAVVADNKTLIAQHKESYANLTSELSVMIANKNEWVKEHKQIYERDIKDADYSFGEEHEHLLENFSDCWSETISVSDEGAEARPAFKPFGVYNPSELQEPYFTSMDEMKAALRQQDAAMDRRKSRREQRRRLECLIAKRRDPVLEQLRQMNDDIQTARAELLDSMITGEGISPGLTGATDKTKHNSLMPKQALSVSPSMLAQAVAIKSLAAKYATVMGFFTKHTLSGAYFTTSEPGRTRQPAEIGLLSFRNGNIIGETQQAGGNTKRAPSTGPGARGNTTIGGMSANASINPGAARASAGGLSNDNKQLHALKPYARNALAYISQQLEVERKAHALLTLISSPYGRYLMPFHKILSDGAPFPSGARSNSFYIMCSKSDLFIPAELQEAILTLQNLSERYFRTSVGRKDLYLIAAACQTELDLRAQNATNTNNPNNANNELQHLGLSRRPPNLDYMLLLQGKLNNLIPYFEDTRSTSAISGLNKSATHRSLADPGRTSQRYPQTCKYIQTILEQVMRRFVAMPGVLSGLYEECIEGISNIKGRILEAVVIELINILQTGSTENIDRARGGCSFYENNVMLLRCLHLLQTAINTLGAGTVFEILRGLVYPVTLLRGAGFINGVEKTQKPIAESDNSDKKPRKFNYLTEEDVESVARMVSKPENITGSFDASLLQKIDDSNARRRLLLQTQYGGRHHLNAIKQRKRRAEIYF